MDRRRFLSGALASSLVCEAWQAMLPPARAAAGKRAARVRPGDDRWPTPASWEKFNRAVGGRLVQGQSPFAPCIQAADSPGCAALFKEFKNPYYISDHVNLTQTTGWVDAWVTQPSVYAVAARNSEDVAAAVNFARENNLRLVVKGGGHSYLGTSNAPDSLMIWMHAIDDITLHG